MPKIELIIGDRALKLLRKYAQANGATPEQYASGILSGWVNQHIEGFFVKKMKEKTHDELEEIFGEPDP